MISRSQLLANKLRRDSDILVSCGRDYSDTLLDAARELERLEAELALWDGRESVILEVLDAREKEIEDLKAQCQSMAMESIATAKAMRIDLTRDVYHLLDDIEWCEDLSMPVGEDHYGCPVCGGIFVLGVGGSHNDGCRFNEIHGKIERLVLDNE